ncbi:MAG: RNA polymerase sigma factor [Polyangiaceae bacterium]|jgi:RNA polymerase sigma-70 factor (ECF subfamily)|nr:RNA polymerase sigma factor [Polyangiaceae bacterium]
MAPTPDLKLIEEAQNGTQAALAELAQSIRPHIERQLARYPVSEEDRRDLLQITLMQVCRKIESFRGDASFSTWLFRVTANEALMMMRSQRRHRARLVEGMDMEDLGAIADADTPQDGAGSAATSEVNARVRDALKDLPESYRAVVIAHYHQDLGLQEIADRLNLTESAVRSRLHRARSRLRTVLTQDGAVVAAA